MFCPKCGNELPEAAAFCNACGASIEKAPEVKPAAMSTAYASKRSGPNPKLIAAIVALAVVVIVLVVAVGSCSSNGSGSAASSQVYSGKLGKLVALSNDELARTLESDGFTKSGDTYTKGEIEVDLDDAKGYRIITVSEPTLAYQLLSKEGPGFDQLGAYFESVTDSEFSVGVCDVAGGKGVVVGAGGTSGCLVMVFEPGHFENMKEVAANVSFSNAMSADEAAAAFAEGLKGKGYAHVDGDDIGKASASTSTSTSTTASSGAASSTSGSVATHDTLTGTVLCSGGKAPDAVNKVLISDDEIIIVGKLNWKDGGTLGSKTWSFGLDEDTVYGGVSGQGFKEQPLSEVAGNWESCNFPTLVLELEDGMVKRAYQQS